MRLSSNAPSIDDLNARVASDRNTRSPAKSFNRTSLRPAKGWPGHKSAPSDRVAPASRCVPFGTRESKAMPSSVSPSATNRKASLEPTV